MNEPEDPLVNASLIRAARGLLGLSQTQLAEDADITTRTLSKIESGIEARPDKRRREATAAVKGALERRGVEFILPDAQTGEGVRLRRGAK